MSSSRSSRLPAPGRSLRHVDPASLVATTRRAAVFPPGWRGLRLAPTWSEDMLAGIETAIAFLIIFATMTRVFVDDEIG